MKTAEWTQRTFSDGVVVGLALISVVLLGLSAFGVFNEDQRMTVFYIDVVICLLFATEFLASWSHMHWRPIFLLRNWYDLIGMIPVAHPVFVEGGWLLTLWVVVVLARIARAVDRLYGERVIASLTMRGTAALVDNVKHPITVAVLEEVAAVLQSGHYTRNIAAALAENRQQIKDMVREKLEQDRLTGRITAVPFTDRLVDSVSETTLRVIFSVLDDPRTDELISDLLRENILQMRTQVHEHAYGDGKGAASWNPAEEQPDPSRSHAGSSAGHTAAVLAQTSGVTSPDPDAGALSSPSSNGTVDSTRPAESPDPLARWRRRNA